MKTRPTLEARLYAREATRSRFFTDPQVTPTKGVSHALEDKLNAAGHMVVGLDKKTPGLKNLLKSRGIGDSALIASLLIQQAERYWARWSRRRNPFVVLPIR